MGGSKHRDPLMYPQKLYSPNYRSPQIGTPNFGNPYISNRPQNDMCNYSIGGWS